MLTVDINKHENDHQEPHERAVKEKNFPFMRQLTNLTRKYTETKITSEVTNLSVPDSDHSFEVIIQ